MLVLTDAYFLVTVSHIHVTLVTFLLRMEAEVNRNMKDNKFF